MRAESNAPTLSCVPGGIDVAERPGHFALIRRLFTEQVRERQEIANGYVFRFEPESFSDLARFVENERKCCLFLSFQLTVSPNGGPIWLRLEGPEGAQALIAAEILG